MLTGRGEFGNSTVLDASTLQDIATTRKVRVVVSKSSAASWIRCPNRRAATQRNIPRQQGKMAGFVK